MSHRRFAESFTPSTVLAIVAAKHRDRANALAEYVGAGENAFRVPVIKDDFMMTINSRRDIPVSGRGQPDPRFGRERELLCTSHYVAVIGGEHAERLLRNEVPDELLDAHIAVTLPFSSGSFVFDKLLRISHHDAPRGEQR